MPSCCLQSEGKQLPEGDCGLLRHQKESDHTCSPTYVCYYRHAGQQRSITGGVCHARTCIHKNDTTLCKSHGQEPEGQHEYSKEQDGIINNTPYYIYHYFISYSKYRPLPLTVQGGPVGLVGWKKIILASLRYFFPPSLALVIGKEQPGQ